jgi:hypothetical protein
VLGQGDGYEEEDDAEMESRFVLGNPGHVFGIPRLVSGNSGLVFRNPRLIVKNPWLLLGNPGFYLRSPSFFLRNLRLGNFRLKMSGWAGRRVRGGLYQDGLESGRDWYREGR